MEDHKDDNHSPTNSKFKLENDNFGEFGDEWDDNDDDFETFDEPMKLKSSSNDKTSSKNIDFEAHSSSMKVIHNYEDHSESEYTNTVHENFQIVEPPIEYLKYLETLRFSSVIKMICAVLFIYSLISTIFKLYFLIGGMFIGIFGFWASRNMRKFLILVLMGLICLDGLAELIGSITIYALDNTDEKSESGGFLNLFIHFIVIGIRAGIVYYLYKNWLKLPTDGMQAFSKFITSETSNDTEYIV